MSRDYRQMYNDEHFEPNQKVRCGKRDDDDFKAMSDAVSAEGVTIITEDGSEIDGFFDSEEIVEVAESINDGEVIDVEQVIDAEQVIDVEEIKLKEPNPRRKRSMRTRKIDKIFSINRMGRRRKRRFDSDDPEITDAPETTDAELEVDDEFQNLLNECKLNAK